MIADASVHLLVLIVGRTADIVQVIYHPNRMRFGANGVTISTGCDDVEQGFRRAIDRLKATAAPTFLMLTSARQAPARSLSVARSRVTLKVVAIYIYG